MSDGIANPAVQTALKAELTGIRGRVKALETELDSLRKREAALVLLVGSAAQARPVGGDSLRAAVLEYLRRKDSLRQGIHYRDITEALLLEGYVINGRDRLSNVRASIGHGPKAAALFESLGHGRYTWR
jgi:hypothetical protein